MNTLFVSGANPKTLNWFARVAASLGIDDSLVVKHRYSFWVDGLPEPSLARETAHLPALAFDLAIAKSLGSLVLLQGLLEKRLSCNRIVLFGIPLTLFEETGFNARALSLLQQKNCLVVQQVDDRLGPAVDIQNFKPANLLIIDGNDHQYTENNLYADTLRHWLLP